LSNNHRVYGEDIKYDSHGNMLVTGNFYADSIDCDPGIGNSFVKGNGKYDIFIAKYNSIGQHIWSFAIGSNDDDFINALYVDKNDNVFVTGSYSGSLMNLDPKGNTCILGNQGSSDMFCAKYDSTGQIIWGYGFGGPSGQSGRDVVTDKNDNVFITGVFFGSVDFDYGLGTVIKTSNGGYDVYLMKLKANGIFDSVITLGGVFDDQIWGIDVDTSSNVYIGGNIGAGTATLHPVGSNTVSNNISGSNYLIAKYSNNLNYLWNACGTYPNGCSSSINRITIDKLGTLHVTGVINGFGIDCDPGPGIKIINSNGGEDIFLASYKPNGELKQAANVGGSGLDLGNGISSDQHGNIYNIGEYIGTLVDFDLSNNNYFLSSTNRDAYVVKYDSNYNFQFAFPIVGIFDANYGLAIDADTSGGFCITGHLGWGAPDFDPTVQTYTLNGTFDAFVANYTKKAIIGIEELLLSNESINLFPNPSSEYVFLKNFPNGEYFIYNSSGMLVQKVKINSNLERITLPQASSGTYFITNDAAKGYIGKKFIIQEKK
ncbi:MAG TPA: T9SS type A sorting domain-containing protein, partial [Bacteroidia bacterium]|nr:T9SS type A sorting domain-containing protein [Bacteroidia bacterium]